MRRSTGITVTASLLAAVGLASTGLASAHENPPGHDRRNAAQPPPDRAGMVFVQSNDLKANSVLAFRRAADGTLSASDTFLTGGRGGAQTDNPFDPLASQDSMVFDEKSATLMVVNAGSNTVSTFRVQDERLTDLRTVDSGGQFPVSIAVSGDLVYVLNAGGETNVSGFRLVDGGLQPLAHSTRELGITNDAVPLFTASPPQIGFSPDGGQLVVTTKSANTIEVFAVRDNGTPAKKAVSTKSTGNVPFAFTFDAAGHLLVTEAEKSGVTSYTLNGNGTLDVITPSVESGQQVLCWIARAGKFFYGTNPGSSTVSLYTVDADGKVALGGEDGVIATAGGAAAAAEVAAAAAAQQAGAEQEAGAEAPGAGPIDLAATADGKLLYVQNTLQGTIEAFRVDADGSLALVDTLDEGLPVFADGSGMEGLVVI